MRGIEGGINDIFLSSSFGAKASVRNLLGHPVYLLKGFLESGPKTKFNVGLNMTSF